MVRKMCGYIRDFGCGIWKSCVLLAGVDGVSDDKQLGLTRCRAAHGKLSMCRSEKAHGCEMGDRDVFDPVVSGGAGGQQGFEVQPIDVACHDENTIAVVDQVLRRL